MEAQNSYHVVQLTRLVHQIFGIQPYIPHPCTRFSTLPVVQPLWLSRETGNANFFYVSTLVFEIMNGVALMNCVWIRLRIVLELIKKGHEVV